MHLLMNYVADSGPLILEFQDGTDQEQSLVLYIANTKLNRTKVKSLLKSLNRGDTHTLEVALRLFEKDILKLAHTNTTLIQRTQAQQEISRVSRMENGCTENTQQLSLTLDFTE